MTEKQFQYNVNKNSIEYNEKHFAYCNGEQNKITDKLNELNDENEVFKNSDNIAELETEIMKLKEENKELKQQLTKIDRLIDDLGSEEMRR